MSHSRFILIGTFIAIMIFIITNSIAKNATSCQQDCIANYNTLKKSCEVAYKAENDPLYMTCMDSANKMYEVCLMECGQE